MCSIAFRCSQRGPDVTLNGTRNSTMETKVPNFVSTMSRTIKCNHVSKLFVDQQGLFCTVKLKTYNCIVFADVSTHKIISFQNLSLGFVLKIFLKFREFQPRYSYKIYSYIKQKRVYSIKISNSRCKSKFSKCQPYAGAIMVPGICRFHSMHKLGYFVVLQTNTIFGIALHFLRNIKYHQEI